MPSVKVSIKRSNYSPIVDDENDLFRKKKNTSRKHFFSLSRIKGICERSINIGGCRSINKVIPWKTWPKAS